MSTKRSSRQELAALVEPGVGEPPLDRAALLIAKEEYPDLDIEASLALIDDMAERVRRAIGDELDPYLIVGGLNRVLFKELGFAGNADQYLDPRNSYMNLVLERKLGIPITLAIIYLEVGRRLCLPVRGVNLPGHFLVAYQAEGEELLIDCFDGGNVVIPGQVQALLDRSFEGRVRFRREFFDPVSHRSILARMLGNLKGIYVERQDLRRAVWVSDLLLLVNPAAPWEYRDRGLLHFQLRQMEHAEPDLRRYLELNPEAPDADRVRRVVREIERLRDQPA